ncbi:recombinase family protein [Hoeflea sp.]|uniref:recombinase family protein n=1 Tax=Hoeflea sp. TaxID=1940281 RepID=UPI0019AECFB9|nr:recombinase family protein [Hoeflea sp.]MBC7283288.1 recombinase family protein [Hoeflea sp.]
MSVNASIPQVVIAYRRVSTSEQGESGVGLEAQKKAIEAYASEEKLIIEKWFDDEKTAAGEESIWKRQGLQAAADLARRNGWSIIVSDLSRLSRDVISCEDFILTQNLKVVSATEGGLVTKSTLRAKVSRAEYERDVISERTKAALDGQRRQGRALGNPASLGKARKASAASRKAIAGAKVDELVRWFVDRPDLVNLSVPALVKKLKDLGMRSSTGKTWTQASLRKKRKDALLSMGLLAGKLQAEPVPVVETGSKDLEDEGARAKNPIWGMF